MVNFRQLVLLLALSFLGFAPFARAENITLNYNAGSPACVGPPGGFGLSVGAGPTGWFGLPYTAFVRPHVFPAFPLTNVSMVRVTPLGSDGSCGGSPFPGFYFPGGGAHNFVANGLPWGSGNSKWVGIFAWVHGGSTLRAQLVTSARTITVQVTGGRYGGQFHPFVFATNKKIMYGYRVWYYACGSGTDGYYTKTIPLLPGEIPQTFNGFSNVFDNAACGGGVEAAHGHWDIDSGLRLMDGASPVPLAGEPVGILTSPLRVRKHSNNVGIVLVPPADPDATHLRVTTPSGVMAIKQYKP